MARIDWIDEIEGRVVWKKLYWMMRLSVPWKLKRKAFRECIFVEIAAIPFEIPFELVLKLVSSLEEERRQRKALLKAKRKQLEKVRRRFQRKLLTLSNDKAGHFGEIRFVTGTNKFAITTSPRYDEVFWEGVAWLDTL